MKKVDKNTFSKGRVLKLAKEKKSEYINSMT